MMTIDKDLIERLATEAGIIAGPHLIHGEKLPCGTCDEYCVERGRVNRFAALIAEECAKLAVEPPCKNEDPDGIRFEIAGAIRAKFGSAP
jgi:hypothetical protein